MTLLLAANPIRVTIAGSAPGPQGVPGVGVEGLTVDGLGRLVGQLSDGTASAPIPLPAGPPGRGIASVTMVAGALAIALTDGSVLPPIDLSGLFASGTFLTTQDGTALLTQDGQLLGTVTSKGSA